MRYYSDIYKKHKAVIDKKFGFTDITFTALAGHVCRYIEPKEYIGQWDKKWGALYEELPLVPSTWKIDTIPTRDKLVKDLKAELKSGKYDVIAVGTDSDIEGYGIFYLLKEYLGLQKYKTLRFFEVSQTEKDVLNSFLTMSDCFSGAHQRAIETYRSRSMRDWALGMSMTIGLSVRWGFLIKYGSVKAPSLKLIYDNCYAIDNFQQITTYGIKSKHTEGFESILINDDDNKDRSFENKEEAEVYASKLNMQAVVQSFKKETKMHKAPKLYALSDLQIDAAKLGYSPDQTLAIAQKLYEERKILTYPRTSGNYLASGKAAEFPDLLKSIKNIPDIKPFVLRVTASDIARASSDANIINDKEVAKSSHDALIPTGASVDWDDLTKQEQDIFLLVCKRFLAHFLPLFVEEKYTMLLENNGGRFKANGRKTIDNGFNDLFGKTSDDEIIPEHKSGDIVKIDSNEIYEKTSQPPARYTTGTIIKAMKNIGNSIEDPELKKLMRESEGIGTEATRGGIIKELKDNNYISISKNAIYITDEGRKYIECIRMEKEDGTYDYGIADPVQVAYWSAQDKQIQIGEKTLDEVMNNFYKYLNKKVSEFKTSGDPVKRLYGKAAIEANLPSCPLCGSKVSSGKFGYYCSSYKESGCKLSIPNEIASKKLTDNQKKGLLEGRKIHAKGFKSKAGKEFEADMVLNKETGKVEFDFGSSHKSYSKK